MRSSTHSQSVETKQLPNDLPDSIVILLDEHTKSGNMGANTHHSQECRLFKNDLLGEVRIAIGYHIGANKEPLGK